MGYSISWIAFKDTAPEEAGRLLALSRTGRLEKVPESMFCGAKLDTGWYLVVINENGHEFVGEQNLRRVSATCEILAAGIEEHVMASSAEYWKGGSQMWAVSHEAESGDAHLAEHGAFPDAYLSIKDRLLASQKTGEADYVFDIPLKLAESIVGYKHDEVAKIEFEVLSKAPRPSSGGFFSQLFRKQ